MMRSAHTALLAAVSTLALGAVTLPALAQTAAPAKPAAPAAQAAPAAPAAPAAAAPADPVIATVNGRPIKASEVAIADEDIGPGLSQVQGPQRIEYVLSFLTDMTLLAQAAEAQKLDQSPDFQQRLAYAAPRPSWRP